MIIAFCGLKTSGKTTAAEYLVKERGFQRLSFAGPLKESCQLIFQLSDEQVYGSEKEVFDHRWGMTPRQILQRFGTEVGRQIDESVWIKNMQFRLQNVENAVIDDCRFPNEAQAVRDAGGVVLGIQRPGLVVDNHPSELELVDNWDTMTDSTLNNVSDISDLYVEIDKVLNDSDENRGISH